MSSIHTRAGLLAIVVASVAAAPAPASAAQVRGCGASAQASIDVSRLAGLTGAEQLRAISEQTGGGHLALINWKRCVRRGDGALVRLTTR